MGFLDDNFGVIVAGAAGVVAFVYLRKKLGTPASMSVTTPAPTPLPSPTPPQEVVPPGTTQPGYPVYKPVRLPTDGPIQVSSSGRWLDQTTYRQEMPPTRDLMPPFLMDPPDCPRSLFKKRQLGPNCADMKRIECKAKGGHVTYSDFEPVGPNHYAVKYGYCVDQDQPKEPDEIGQILAKRCPPVDQCPGQGRVCAAILRLPFSIQTFGKDPSHRHGQYKIWKCASAKGA